VKATLCSREKNKWSKMAFMHTFGFHGE